jgi:hypothetical protein
VTAAWVNPGEDKVQTATGEVIERDGAQYVKYESGQLENGKPTYNYVQVGEGVLVNPTQEQVEDFQAQVSEEAKKSVAPVAEEVVTETPVVEPVVEEKVQTQAEINKQRQAAKKAEAQRQARKSNTLLAELTRLGGVAVKDKLDVTGERGAMLTGGYSRVFKKDSKAGLMNHIESGNLDEYLPYALLHHVVPCQEKQDHSSRLCCNSFPTSA